MKKIAFVFAYFCLIAISCNTSSFTNGNPKDVLIKFFDALIKKDITTAKSLATKDSETMLNLMEMGMKMAPDSLNNKTIMDKTRLQFENAKITGENAIVPVKDKQTGEMISFNLIKESGNWKVAFDMNTMMQIGQNKMREKGFDQKKIDNIMDKMKGVLDSNPELKKALNDTLQ